MSIIPSQEERDVQRALAKAKHQERERRFTETPVDTATPAWFEELKTSADKDPNVKAVMGRLALLIEKIPIVAESQTIIAKDNYFKELIKELARVYCARINIVLMNSTLTTSQKDQAIDALLQERNIRIAEMARLLGSYIPNTSS